MLVEMRRLFEAVTGQPRWTLAAVAVVVAVSALPILGVRTDNRPDAFIPADHPALIAKQRVESEFGLKDPMMLALDTGAKDGIYQLRPITLIKDITSDVLDGLQRLKERRLKEHGEVVDLGDHPVYSLATEYSVSAVGDIPQEFPFLDPFPVSSEDFARLKRAVEDLELYTGVIVSEDGSAAAVVVVPPPDHAEAVYQLVEEVASQARKRLGPGEAIHVAGEAAVRSEMGRAVARDGLRFNPICVGVVTLFLYVAFRNLAGVLVPFAVVGASVLFMLGAMCFAGKPFYIITSAIPVTVMSIGVASSMHLLAEFYEHLRLAPAGASKRELVVAACHRLWLPVLFTAATDVAGFASTFFSGIMPPLEWFGFFSALGLGASLVFAWTVVPASLMLLDPRKAQHQRLRGWASEGRLAKGLRRLGLACYDHPLAVLLSGAVAVAAGVVGALDVRANQSMESAFREQSPIVQSNRALNRLFHGTYFLDILLEGEAPGSLIRPEVLEKIEAIEDYVKSLPGVGGTVSVVGFAKKIHQILNQNDPEENRIPGDAATVREELDLIRKTSPTKRADLRRVVSDDHRVANVRVRVREGEYVAEKVIVEKVEQFLNGHFDGLGVQATLAGRVNMDYHWMQLVLRSNVGNVALALALVFACMLLMFRSALGGLYCLVPVLLAVLYTYGVMGYAGIDLSIGTSMFAAIATGVGVDYPTHILERLRVRIGREGAEPREAFAETLGIAGKAVFFNAAAVACGFLVLVVSELPILVHFGVMIAVGIITACLASLTVLPALVRWFQPAFVWSPRQGRQAGDKGIRGAPEA
jgi:hypothetical protein